MKLVVIGGGPGGYVAAIRGAQLGAEVTLIEKEKLGGTCLNIGCIPTKVLLHSSELLNEIKEARTLGIEVNNEVKINWTQLQNRKNTVVNTLVSGVSSLLEHNKVKVINGTAAFEGKSSIKVTKDQGESENIQFDNVIISSGSVPFIPPIEGRELEGVIDSTGALSLDSIPKSMVIIGGGVIGIEFANIFNSLGCKVTVIEMLPYILPPVDREISEILKEKLKKDGIDIYNNCKVTKIENNNENLNVSFEEDNDKLNIEAQKVLIAVGRRANISNLNLESTGVYIEKGCIWVNDNMETNIKGIYAIGDCTGKICLPM